jgi:hypothetical protein
MHQSLVERPFVLHNLVSAQWSPAPLMEFQMATTLKILMPSGSKKGTKIYFFFSLKSPANELSPSSPAGPLWRERERYLFTGHFYISQNPQKFL